MRGAGVGAHGVPVDGRTKRSRDEGGEGEESLKRTGNHKEDACLGCRFWVDLGEVFGQGAGTCRRHAPVPYPLSSPDNGVPDDAIWPRTDESDWCGEWEASE